MGVVGCIGGGVPHLVVRLDHRRCESSAPQAGVVSVVRSVQRLGSGAARVATAARVTRRFLGASEPQAHVVGTSIEVQVVINLLRLAGGSALLSDLVAAGEVA